MADQTTDTSENGSTDSGDKTEKPTSKRLNDARKKGDVSKSRELTSTAGLILWLALGSAVSGYAAVRLGALSDTMLQTVTQGWADTGFALAVRTVGMQAVEAGVLLSVLLLVPATVVGLFSDYIQTGPILAFDKVSPKLEHLNPVAGIKRMFSMDNLVEVLKAIAKTALLLVVAWLIIRPALPQMVTLARSPENSAHAFGGLIWSLTIKLLAWSIGLFALVSLLDAAYQRYSFTKKMRMSMRDIKEEAKESEGNPLIKSQRRQAHQNWSQQNSAHAAREANVLIVNPTHIAFAIDYDEQDTPVPTIAAKGEGDEARAMREAAGEAGTPIVRNIPLARDLFARGEVDEIVPDDLFEIIAEVILWAREVRELVDAERASMNNPLAAQPIAQRRIQPPGEDLTHYRDHFDGGVA